MNKTPEQIAFETKIAELKTQHPGCSLHLVDLEDLEVQVVLRSMSPAEFKHLDSLTDDVQRNHHMDQYVKKCTLLVVQPEGQSFDELLQVMPGITTPLSKELMKVTGALTKAVSKKL